VRQPGLGRAPAAAVFGSSRIIPSIDGHRPPGGRLWPL